MRTKPIKVTTPSLTDGDVGRVNMRIPFQPGISVAVDVLSDSSFSAVILATLAQADSTDSANRNGT
jgi:hypothetical protein